MRTYCLSLTLAILVCSAGATVHGQCPDEPRLDNFTGAGEVVCPCFIPGEEAAAVFSLPAGEFPIEIVRVGIGWGSQFGGNPDQLEQSIHIYEGGLPNPGTPIFTIDGPVLVDGVINEFDLEPLPGEIIISSSPFMVSLEFLNPSDIFAPSVVHDGNGCNLGQNAVFAIPGGWIDACLAGVTGDWVFYVFYRKLDCGGGTGPGSIPDGKDVAGTPLLLDKTPLGDVILNWEDSCSTDANDYGIYSGFLGAFYSHFSTVCTTGGATSAIVSSDPLDRYYLVVPTDGQDEGSYGRNGSGNERPQGGGACKAQQTTVCP